MLQAQERFGLEIADRVRAELNTSFALLAAMPKAGHRRDDLTRDRSLRFWSVGPTLIAYRARAFGIEIVLVERGSRNWKRVLRSAR